MLAGVTRHDGERVSWGWVVWQADAGGGPTFAGCLC